MVSVKEIEEDSAFKDSVQKLILLAEDKKPVGDLVNQIDELIFDYYELTVSERDLISLSVSNTPSTASKTRSSLEVIS